MCSKIIEIKEEEFLKYVKNNFKKDALVELSYNRVFLPGKLLHINNDDMIMTLQLQGDLLHQTVDIDLKEILSELVELRYTYDDEETVISII